MMRWIRRRGGPVAALNIIALIASILPRPARADGDRVIEREAPATLEHVEQAETPSTQARGTGSKRAPIDYQKPTVTATAAQFGSSTTESLPAGTEANGATNQAISLPQGAGKVDGMGESFSTDPSTGIASFHIPIALPKARGGVQPSLSLSYSSSGGHGVAGIGWSLGVPFIARQTDRQIPNYKDPASGGAWAAAQDRFVFNGGQELVPICLVSSGICSGALAGEAMPTWSNGWQYFRPRVESSYQRFFWSPNHRTWRVQSKTGESMEIGAPLDGSGDVSSLETDPNDSSRIFRWALARQYDAQRVANPSDSSNPAPVNAIVYRYVLSGGISYLSDVYDTPPAAGAATASLSAYAHHAHLTYEARPDAVQSYRRGWLTNDSLRLTGVDVASKSFNGGSSSARELLNRLHLRYDATFHVSLLASAQLEGRCSSAIVEDTNGLLPLTACPLLPAMTFGYDHVTPFSVDGSPGSVDLPGHEGFDDRVQTFATSPPHSIDESLTELMDINGDALPDVLVTAPALYGGSEGVYFNGAGGTLSFGVAQPMPVSGVASEDANTLQLTNPNVSILDVDGDGTIDLMHMPQVLDYSVYTPHHSASGWSWLGRAITTASAQNAKIDFTHNAPNTRVMDVNGDGFVDVVVSSGTQLQTFFSLGRYPGGDGQYGTASWVSATTAALSNDATTSCLPWSATPISFSDADVRIADMNGDGLPDIVRVRAGDVRYWPGRGNGFWGTGDASTCPGNTFGQGQEISMSTSPQFGIVGSDSLLLDDIDGDGLSDLLKVGFNDVSIYLNVDGVGWTARHLIANSPPDGTTVSRVRVTDVNGSGTPDILWGQGNAYKYIDLTGGMRPWLLSQVANGVGKTTDISYASSTSQMLAAALAGNPWGSTSPLVSHVVASTVENDNLGLVGHAAGSYRSDYTYRDPIYDGRQREFRGFRTVAVTHEGDSNSPSSTQTVTYLLGECTDEPGDVGPSPCTPQGQWRDNPREALKGLPRYSEIYDIAGGVTGAATHTTYRLRRLYTGLDGRDVRVAFRSSDDTYRYDTSAFVASSSTVSLTDVELETSPGVVTTDSTSSIPLRASAGRAHLHSSFLADVFGNATDAIADGCIDGCLNVDESITTHTTPGRRSDDASGWTWRTTESYVTGSTAPASLRKHEFTTYDVSGNPTTISADLWGTLALDRFHQNPTKSIAPAPTNASVDGLTLLGTTTYDGFGNAVFVKGTNSRCTSATLDTDYAQLLIVQTSFVGTVDGSGCGATALSTLAAYDRGLNVVTTMTGVRGEIGTAAYDGFGRVLETREPDPNVVGSPSAQASLIAEYFLPSDATVTPYTVVHVSRQTGTASYQNAWSYVDGLGRTILTLTQADPAAGDGGTFTVNGWKTFDAKGAAERAYLPWFVTVDPHAYLLNSTPTTAFERVRYDAFGGATQTFALDGTVASQTYRHAMSEDVWDAADLSMGPHQGTFATARQDGHGRIVSTIERIHVGTSVESHDSQTAYLPSGEPVAMTRIRVGAADAPIVRWARYDSLGRRVLNVEPDSTVNFSADPSADPNTFHAWRYAYDDSGDIVGTSDARGCGENYAYDAGGRLTIEDYSPCTDDQALYSAPSLVAGTGIEVLNRYDVADADLTAISNFSPNVAQYLGRLTATSDRGAKTIPAFDGRGRVVATARKMVKPGSPDEVLANRYAPRWYVRDAGYDLANRVVVQTTGASVTDLLAVDSTSAVTISYSAGGQVTNVGGSYGSLVAGVSHTADLLPTQIRYGDAASTATTFSYDTRRRVSAVQTMRGPPALWSAPPSSYVPAPAPVGAPSSFQADLQDLAFTYDVVNNPTEISDLRDPNAWPAGAKPTTRDIQYDDLYRVTRIDQTVTGGTDVWTSPFAPENASVVLSTAAKPSPHVSFDNRVGAQTFAYDWAGNTSQTGDDASGFYDRSLGTITNGSSGAGPYQLQGATNAGAGSRDGHLSVVYDSAGNLSSLAVRRNGPCLPAGALCSQRFAYVWDEANHLVRARRWDLSDPGLASDPTPTATATAELHYSYGSDDQRVLKTAVDETGSELQTVYIFASLELRRSAFVGGEYEDDQFTESPQLYAGSTRLGRLYYASNGEPTESGGALHVLLELPDQLGSTNVVIDRDTGELVEVASYQAYGAPETDYRPDRWKGERADYRFTGKEDDIEIGLTYFGARYYAPSLNRWVSPDPMAVHAWGADANVYAYVHGRVFESTDPLGLAGEDTTIASTTDGSGVPDDESVNEGGGGVTSTAGEAKEGQSDGSLAAGTDQSSGFGATPEGLTVFTVKSADGGEIKAFSSSTTPLYYLAVPPKPAPSLTATLAKDWSVFTLTAGALGELIIGEQGMQSLSSAGDFLSAKANYWGSNSHEFAAGYWDKIQTTYIVGAIVAEVFGVMMPPPGTSAGGALVAGDLGPVAGESETILRPPVFLQGNNTLQPGEHAGESIPARGTGRDFTPEERTKINEIGNDTGCHTCGTNNPGTKTGNFIPDHQPPSATAPPGADQRLYPHCLNCSRVQGGQVRQVKP